MKNFTRARPTAVALRESGKIATATHDGRSVSSTLVTSPLPQPRPCSHPNRPAPVTCSPARKTLSYPQVAAILSEITGRTIRHIDLTAEQLTARWAATGLHEDLARTATDLDIAISLGDYDYTPPDVTGLTDQPPRRFRTSPPRTATKAPVPGSHDQPG
jgi:hypothetical protein